MGLLGLSVTMSACGGSPAEAQPTGVSESDVSRIAAAASHHASTSASAPSTGSDAARAGNAASETPASGSPSAAGASSASALPAEFAVPAAAKAHTKEGALAFVKFYWETLTRLDAHPQKGVVEALSAAGCASCTRQAKNVQYLKSHALHAQALRPQFGPPSVRADSIADSVVVQNSYQDSGSEHLSASNVTQTFPAIKGMVETRADWTNGGWKIGAIGIHKG